jgi:D-alanyl-D-alanine carboxypeptidase
MNASNLQKKLLYKEKVIYKVQSFNRKHKSLSFLGLIYAMVMITSYNCLFYFYSNAKRFICLACILLFFVSSSSFSYPAMSFNISFDSDVNIDGQSYDTIDNLSETIDYESQAELVVTTVDDNLIKEAMDSANPDVTEAEHLKKENNATLSDILAATSETDEEKSEIMAYYNESEGVPLSASMQEVSFDSSDWKLILVNKQHPIPDDYDFHLGTISGAMRCDERIITPLLDMMKAANKEGAALIICSPYRDMDRQTMLFTKKVDRYMNGGMSYMEAYNLAAQAVTVPGSSEHQIGLAIDIICDGYSSLDEGFANTKAGQWLAENSYKYGFILRYPLGKEDITSIEYEPWHFRYVGVDAATLMHENNICLEEFWSTYIR